MLEFKGKVLFVVLRESYESYEYTGSEVVLVTDSEREAKARHWALELLAGDEVSYVLQRYRP